MLSVPSYDSSGSYEKYLDTGQTLKENEHRAIVGRAVEHSYDGGRHFHDNSSIYLYVAKEKERLYIKGDVFAHHAGDYGCYYIVTFADSSTMKITPPEKTFYGMGYFILLDGFVECFKIVEKKDGSWAKHRNSNSRNPDRPEKEVVYEKVYAVEGLLDSFLKKPMVQIVKYCTYFGKVEPSSGFSMTVEDGELLMQTLRCIVDMKL